MNLNIATVTIRQTLLDTAIGYLPQEDQKSRLSAQTIHLDRRTVEMLTAPFRTSRA